MTYTNAINAAKWVDKPDRLKIDIIWTDDDHIEILANDRTAWHGTGDTNVVGLLRKLDELGRIALWEYDNEQEYFDKHVEIDAQRKLKVGL